MTKKKFRLWKKQNLEKKKVEEMNDRPLWADDDQQEVEDTNWLSNFKKEVSEAIKIRDGLPA